MSVRLLEQTLAAAQGTIECFVRDDDAGWEMGALDRLLEMFANTACPIDIAVIPAVLDEGAARRLDQWRSIAAVGLHQHGYAHINYEPEGNRKCEFGDARPATRQYADIRAGRDRLSALLGDTDPIFTPPWNRCLPETADALAALGFRLLSQDATATPLAARGLSLLPIDIDWDKHARAAGRDGPAAAIARCITGGTRRIGLMLHHAALSIDDLRPLADVIGVLTVSGKVRFRAMRTWIGG